MSDRHNPIHSQNDPLQNDPIHNDNLQNDPNQNDNLHNDADNTKRRLLKTGLAIGGGALFVAGYSETAKRLAVGTITGSSGEIPRDAHFGDSLTPEYRVTASGKLVSNGAQRVAPSMCMGCWTLCGVRLRIDSQTDNILRIAGNPYHPLSAELQIPYETPVKQAWLSLTGDSGLAGRSTACARGNGMLEIQQSPYRVRQPLKRVGKRGEGKWQTISYQQLIREITEGGDLFGEGHVDGLKAIRDLQTPLNPDNPALGPKANQLLVTNAANEGRNDILKRFATDSFGTCNYGNHGAFCGYAFTAGSGALMDDLNKNPHLKPDIENAEFILYIATSPSQSGKPFKRQARQLASARVNSNFHYIVVAPSQPVSVSLAAGNNHWLPVKPGSDSALVLAMIQWIINHARYNADFLAQPSEKAMQAAGQSHWCNATHLVIIQPGHPRHGRFLRLSDLNDQPAITPLSEQDTCIIIPQNSLTPASAEQSQPARLFYSQAIDTRHGKLNVKTAFQCLKDQASAMTMQQYSDQCGVPVAQIEALAKEFTAHGTRAAVDSHGGNMHSNGFYTAFAIVTLNLLIGNINRKGGTMANPKAWPAIAAGPRYDFVNFQGKIHPKGTLLCRSKTRYEDSQEYQQKIARGQNPYPAKAPWYPLSTPILTEYLTAALDGYPYRLKAWLNHLGNPIYGIPGLRRLAENQLKDPKQLPLIISVDAFINETSALSDYIVPDTVTYESWGIAGTWHDVPTRMTTARWPAVAPRTATTPDQRPICLENFLIDLAKALGTPGFGDNAITDHKGTAHPIHSAEDYYLKAVANLAFTDNGVASASAEDIQLSGLERLLPALQQALKPEEIAKVAYVLARGGRYENASERYQGDLMKYRYQKPFTLWNETLASTINSMTGEHYSGCPTWYPQRLANGTPLHDYYPPAKWPFTLTNFKSNVHSAISCLSPRLSAIKGVNPVYIHPKDAQKIGLQTGDLAVIATPGGEVTSLVLVLESVMPGVLAIEHGYGHRELGNRPHQIDGLWQPANPHTEQGINLNDIGLADPTRQSPGLLLDWVIGSAVRQALPARIRKA